MKPNNIRKYTTNPGFPALHASSSTSTFVTFRRRRPHGEGVREDILGIILFLCIHQLAHIVTVVRLVRTDGDVLVYISSIAGVPTSARVSKRNRKIKRWKTRRLK